MSYCSQCGSSNDDGDSFCWKCGAALHQPAATVSDEPPAPPPARDTPGSARTAPLVQVAAVLMSNNPAPHGSRLLAFVIDIIALWIAVLLIGVIISLFSPWDVELTYGVPLLYFPLAWGIAGTSLGKSLMGLSLKSQDGRRPGIIRSVIRLLAMFLLSPFWFAWWTVLLRKDRRAIHDLLSGTYLVQDQEEAQSKRMLSAGVLALATASIGMLAFADFALTVLGSTPSPFASSMPVVTPTTYVSFMWSTATPNAVRQIIPSPTWPEPSPAATWKTPEPVVAITPMRGTFMWVCSDLAYVRAEPKEESEVLYMVSQNDYWFVTASGSVGGWYLITFLAQAGSTNSVDTYAFMEQSALCLQSLKQRKLQSYCTGYTGYPVRGVYRRNGMKVYFFINEREYSDPAEGPKQEYPCPAAAEAEGFAPAHPPK